MEPFRIDVSDEVLADLKGRLTQTRLPSPVHQAEPRPWGAGVDPELLRRLIDYWLHEFQWRDRERWLNTFPQFRTTIDGRLVHFVHVRAAETTQVTPIPLVLSHGWPYTFAEMLPIVPYLTAPVAHGGAPGDAFDVVVPSLPGHGFSGPLGAAPFLSTTVAEMWHSLMTETLGYERYATYGEDVGSGVSDWTAALHPESVIGLFATHAAFPPPERQQDLTAEEEAFRAWLDEKWEGESAYAYMQGTKPDTFAVALNDSPAGLATLLAEKLHGWSGDGIGQSWSLDEVLTTVMLYWVTGTIGSSFQSYFDGRREDPLPEIEVPVGVSVQRGERGFPRSYAARTYRDIRFWNDLPCGGHFSVKETPDLIAADMREFFRPLRR